MQAARFRFGEFEFDTGSGELRPAGPTMDGEPRRLAPQPTRLLALLADREGELVTREEIRERIWPGVRVDFDTSLHFCIRQIRTALGDSASEPRYVETLPRRGYRLVPLVERLGPAGANGASPRRGRRSLVVALLVLVAAATVSLMIVGTGSGPAHEPPRIGIMPFEPPDGIAGFGSPAPVAEWILEDLMAVAGDRAEIVGPSSTTAYAGSDAALSRLGADYDLDYIINARFIDDASERRMLAELIRVSDGAHIWVRAYTDLADTRGIGLEISGSVATELELAPRPPGTSP